MRLTPELLRMAYGRGIFPMAESADDPTLAWFDPDPRGIIPLDRFHVPARLAKTIRSGRFTLTADHDFAAVIRACAAATPDRRTTWINEEIIAAYCALHADGAAHSVECWREGALVGGLYGVALGGAFFGESMFSRATDASKVALVHLVERLRAGGFQLLDTQFVTPHLARFGAIEIPRADYKRRLARAITAPARFDQAPGMVRQSPSHTS